MTNGAPTTSTSDPPRVRLPELLAPAGDWDCARAAVENGADAIYFGLEKFNARMRARNFTLADLPRLMEFLHSRGVKGYVTFNTLVFENELEEAQRYLQSLIIAGVDAAIVQDVGICRLIRQISSDFPIHVSTQMTVTSAAGVAFARELGANLVVLARECSLKDIAAIRQAGLELAESGRTQSSQGGFPLEVFVHGALCVAYSGQCLTSESLGGRSANRGECAQACRMPYDLISDGELVPLGDRKYLLSPQDLAGLDILPELVHAGVASLKIEGRLKTPEYVANITRVYRNALQKLSRHPAPADASAKTQSANGDPSYDMQMAFSRGLFTGWFRGTDNQKLVHARFGKKRGVFLGAVEKIHGEQIVLRLEAPLKAGDGVVFDAGSPGETEQGGRVYHVRSADTKAPGASKSNGLVTLAFGHGDIDFKRVNVGDKVWKTSDPELDRRVRQTFAGEVPRFQRPVDLEIHGTLGRPMTIHARDEEGHVAEAVSATDLIAATTQPLDEHRLREQLGRLGGTPFRLGSLRNSLEGRVLLPISELNRLRRQFVADLMRERVKPRRWKLIAELTETLAISSGVSPIATVQPRLIVLVRNIPQLEAALGHGQDWIYCEFENPKKYREAVDLFRRTKAGQRDTLIAVAPPRIFKPGEEWILKLVRSCEADAYLVRNYDHLSFFATDRCVGDFSLNVANHLSAKYFLETFRLERLTASYDLNFSQLEALLAAADPERFEITIHQHMPMFHMEHCVFCAFLSKGSDFRDCGRPCDHHSVQLRDRVGATHPLKADAGCRNTVFNAAAQTGAEYLPRMLALGARYFRLEFLDETPEQMLKTVDRYQRLLEGKISGSDLWRELKLTHQLGVTRGQING